MGLVYRAGRVRPDAARQRAGRAGREGREGRWVVKVQPPLDRSSDSRGGMGRSEPNPNPNPDPDPDPNPNPDRDATLGPQP